MIYPTLNIDSRGKISVNLIDNLTEMVVRFTSMDSPKIFVPLANACINQYYYGYADGYEDAENDMEQYGGDIEEYGIDFDD